MQQPVSDATRIRYDGLWRRLWHTPLSRTLRGDVNGSLDREAIVARAGLPPELAAVVERTARRTRLNREEKAEVVRDLVEHFREGLEHGASTESLLRDFGDPNAAAVLIRRSMLRKSPWFNRQLRVFVKVSLVVFATMAGIYLLVAVRDWRQRPNIAVDHVAKLNASIATSDTSERAWPLLREAITGARLLVEPSASERSFGGESERSARGAALSRLLSQTEGTLPAWWGDRPTARDEEPPVSEAAVTAFFERNEPNRDLLLQAAGRPMLGFEIRAGAPTDPEDLTFLDLDEPSGDGGDASTNSDWLDGSLFLVELPYLAATRKGTQLLRADACRAVLGGDGGRAVEDLQAMFGLGAIVRKPSFLLGQLVGIAIDQAAYDTVLDALASRPDAFTDRDLEALATILDAQRENRFVVELDVERLLFEDLAQRIYTDDGKGGGRLAVAGIGGLGRLDGTMAGSGGRAGMLPFLAGPILSRFVLSREEATRIWNDLFDRYERVARTPVWLQDSVDLREIRRIHAELSERGSGTLRNFPLNLLVPALDQAVLQGHAVRLTHDLARTVVELEMERRRLGGWPVESVAATQRSVDPFSGRPLRYGLIDGRPCFWSVGVDRDDDGGVAPADRRRGGLVRPSFGALISEWSAAPAIDETMDGDIVVWRGGGAVGVGGAGSAASPGLDEGVNPREAAEAAD